MKNMTVMYRHQKAKQNHWKEIRKNMAIEGDCFLFS